MRYRSYTNTLSGERDEEIEKLMRFVAEFVQSLFLILTITTRSRKGLLARQEMSFIPLHTLT